MKLIKEGLRPVSGRKPAQESRGTEFRQTLVAWKQTPAAFRPSLRALARELGTTRQLLSHYLFGLEEWRREKDLERLRAQAKAKNVTLAPEAEKRYLTWLRKIEERQARDAVIDARRARKFAASLGNVKHRLSDSWSQFDRSTWGKK
jgi:transcriptional regulator with XRE-family HTH domain